MMRTLLLVVNAAALVAFVHSDNRNVSISSSSGSSSPLAKFVLTFSRPGAFAKEARIAFGDENSTSSACPTGDEGLVCRRTEAQRGADECVGDGACESCRGCEITRARDWPRCCKNHFLCCSQLATACQRCDFPELATFCTKRFKRCF